MAYVSVPKDLTKVKSKLVLNLTKRQIVCFGAAAAIGIPAYFLSRGAVGNTVAILIMIVLMLPAFFLAMYEKDGMPAEKFLYYILRARWFSPGARPYRTENLYSYIEKEGQMLVRTEQRTAVKTTAAKPAKKAGRQHHDNKPKPKH